MNFSKIKSDYLIFLDNVRVDHLVRSWNTSHPKEGQMASASIDIVFQLEKDMTDAEYRRNLSLRRKNVYDIKRTIKNRTNVFIFQKNIVSGKYVCVFNGNVSDLYLGSSVSKRLISVTIASKGSMNQLTEIDSLLAIPFVEQVATGSVGFRLASRSMDIKEADSLVQSKDVNMSKMQISEILNKTKEVAVKTNKNYNDPQGVANFNSILDRIELYNDIDKNLLDKSIIDSGFITDSMIMESMYTTLSRQMNRLMMEFFEMPYGKIAIKAPYWNAPVLYNHIIPDIAIINEQSVDRGSSKITRITVQGDLPSYSTGQQTSYGQRFTTPMVSYKEHIDGTPVTAWLSELNISGGGLDDSLWDNQYIGIQTGTLYDDMNLITDNVSDRYLLYSVAPWAKIYHYGWTAEVISIDSANGISAPSGYKGDLDYTIFARYTEGPYEGFIVVYGGIENAHRDISAGTYLKNGDVIGVSFNPFAQSFDAQFFIKHMYPDGISMLNRSDVDEKTKNSLFLQPKAVLRDFASDKKVITPVDIWRDNLENFSNPSDIEKINGLNATEEIQTLIKYRIGETNKEAMQRLEKYAAFRFKTINSSSVTMNLTTIPMPWLKPGFNVWVDPAGIDEVYYVASVSHRGGSAHQSSTSLQLIMGRPAKAFFGKNEDGSTIFGSLGSNDTYGSGVFVSKTTNADAFEKAASVKSYVNKNGYDDIIKKSIRHKSFEDPTYDISEDSYTQELFKNRTSSPNLSPSSIKDLDFGSELTEDNIQKMLTSVFSNSSTPALVKDRASSIRDLVESIKDLK